MKTITEKQSLFTSSDRTYIPRFPHTHIPLPILVYPILVYPIYIYIYIDRLID